jgi:Flp pilus assembly pilin Flp
MKKLVTRLVRDDRGQDLIEYGLLIGIITAGAVVSISLIGPRVAAYYDPLWDALPPAP